MFINCESNEPVVASVIAASAIVVAESSNARVTSRQLFADLREGRAPESLFRQVSVNSPEEIEMESVSFQDFQEAKFNFELELSATSLAIVSIIACVNSLVAPMSSISYTVPETPVLDMFINCVSGLAIVGVTEPLALPWVALGTVTPFILGYRVLGGEVVASNAPDFIATTVSRTETFEMTMMGAGKSVPEHMLT
jgi:hypothetical protein